TPTIVTTSAVPATEDSPAVPEQTTVKTVTNMTPKNRAHFGLKQLQPHAILKTDQSSSQLMRKWHITSLMTENP
ncbi:hypothetical protein Tco_0274549, partial [Tanacetum coccineum]